MKTVVKNHNPMKMGQRDRVGIKKGDQKDLANLEKAEHAYTGPYIWNTPRPG